MTSAAAPRSSQGSRIGDSVLAARLRRELEGEVLFDAFSRGRYSTDASAYQIEPIGVVVPRSAQDVARTIQIAAEEELPVLPRGGGTSQCGQTVGEAIVVDVSKHLDAVLDFDPAAARVTVQPGLVLDRLNAFLAPHGLMFPVDVSTGSRATLGGMAGNNSCGARSLAYGTMRDNAAAIEAVLADGQGFRFGEVPNGNGAELPAAHEAKPLLRAILLGLLHPVAGEPVGDVQGVPRHRPPPGPRGHHAPLRVAVGEPVAVHSRRDTPEEVRVAHASVEGVGVGDVQVGVERVLLLQIHAEAGGGAEASGLRHVQPRPQALAEKRVEDVLGHEAVAVVPVVAQAAV